MDGFLFVSAERASIYGVSFFIAADAHKIVSAHRNHGFPLCFSIHEMYPSGDVPVRSTEQSPGCLILKRRGDKKVRWNQSH